MQIYIYSNLIVRVYFVSHKTNPDHDHVYKAKQTNRRNPVCCMTAAEPLPWQNPFTKNTQLETFHVTYFRHSI